MARFPLSSITRRAGAGPLVAAALATTAAAVYVRARVRRAEHEHPPAGRFVEVDGARLHYLEHGDGPPLVLLHGNLSMAVDFELGGFAKRVAAGGRRVIAFDRPGFGWSGRARGISAWGPDVQARVIRDALRSIGAECPIVLGHSWGGLVAVAMALDFPDEVRGLVLEGAYLYATPRVDAAIAAPATLPLLGDLLHGTVLPLQFRLGWNTMMRRMFAPAEVPGYFARDFPVWLAARPSQLRAGTREIADVAAAAASLQDRYGGLRMPVALVAGRGDRLVSPDDHSARLHEELPGSDYRLVEGMGHMLHHTAPEQVLAAIEWVERTTASPRDSARLDDPARGPALH